MVQMTWFSSKCRLIYVRWNGLHWCWFKLLWCLAHYPTISKSGSSWDNCVENAHSFNQDKSASSVSAFGLGVDQMKWFITPQSIQSLFHFLSVCLSDIYVCSLTPSIHLMQHFIIYIHAANPLEGSLFRTAAAKHTTQHLSGKSSAEN